MNSVRDKKINTKDEFTINKIKVKKTTKNKHQKSKITNQKSKNTYNK